MQKTFVETREFTTWVEAYLTDDELGALQRVLLANPDRGDVMPGCAGLRKLRIADPRRGMGTRGGARVIYLHIEELQRIYLITVYGKDQKSNFTAQDKRTFRWLVQSLKDQARESWRHGTI